jgi:hypothetical protein
MSPQSSKYSSPVAYSSLTLRVLMMVGRPRRSFRKSPPGNWSVSAQAHAGFCNEHTHRTPTSLKGYCARWARSHGGLPRELCEYPLHDEGHLCSRRGRIGADRTEHEQLFNIAQRPDAGVREDVEGRSQMCDFLPAPAHFFLSSKTTRSGLSRDG